MPHLLLGRENQASAYKRLLDRANAGEPMQPDEVAAIVGDYAQQERDRIMAQMGELSPEQERSLSERLRERRLGAVAQVANDVSVYADVATIMQPVNTPGISQIPVVTNSGVQPAELFRWQWDYWVVEDLLGAIARANTDATGPTGVPDSVVKRVERIQIQEPDLAGADGEQDDASSGGWNTPASSASSATGLWTASHTDRLSTAPEGMDVRMVRLTAIVSTARLPKFFDALGQQNFMTVTGVQLEDIDSWQDLKQGYFYGGEHVARAIIDIETIWLREWTKEYMPDELREALGIPRVVEGEGGGDDGFGDEFGG